MPYGICGIIIESSQQKTPPPKVLTIQLIDANGKLLPGSGSFKLRCDKYTLKFKMKASPSQVLADGIEQSTITATLTVKGPVYEVIGQKITRPNPPLIQETPLGLVMVHFNTNLGTLNPNPANVKTDLSGNATVTTTSTDAGIAKIIGQASGIGDSFANVHFMPKIIGVTETFVEPNSPTNFDLTVIPTDSSKLNFAWQLIYPGAPCGYLTGQAQGLGLSKNGYFHGPSQGFPDGCDPTNYEALVKVQVTVTDKDGGSDTKTFPARAYEGQGLFKFPALP